MMANRSAEHLTGLGQALRKLPDISFDGIPSIRRVSPACRHETYLYLDSYEDPVYLTGI